MIYAITPSAPLQDATHYIIHWDADGNIPVSDVTPHESQKDVIDDFAGHTDQQSVNDNAPTFGLSDQEKGRDGAPSAPLLSGSSQGFMKNRKKGGLIGRVMEKIMENMSTGKVKKDAIQDLEGGLDREKKNESMKGIAKGSIPKEIKRPMGESAQETTQGSQKDLSEYSTKHRIKNLEGDFQPVETLKTASRIAPLTPTSTLNIESKLQTSSNAFNQVLSQTSPQELYNTPLSTLPNTPSKRPPFPMLQLPALPREDLKGGSSFGSLSAPMGGHASTHHQQNDKKYDKGHGRYDRGDIAEKTLPVMLWLENNGAQQGASTSRAQEIRNQDQRKTEAEVKNSPKLSIKSATKEEEKEIKREGAGSGERKKGRVDRATETKGIKNLDRKSDGKSDKEPDRVSDKGLEKTFSKTPDKIVSEKGFSIAHGAPSKSLEIPPPAASAIKPRAALRERYRNTSKDASKVVIKNPSSRGAVLGADTPFDMPFDTPSLISKQEDVSKHRNTSSSSEIKNTDSNANLNHSKVMTDIALDGAPDDVSKRLHQKTRHGNQPSQEQWKTNIHLNNEYAGVGSDSNFDHDLDHDFDSDFDNDLDGDLRQPLNKSLKPDVLHGHTVPSSGLVLPAVLGGQRPQSKQPRPGFGEGALNRRYTKPAYQQNDAQKNDGIRQVIDTKNTDTQQGQADKIRENKIEADVKTATEVRIKRSTEPRNLENKFVDKKEDKKDFSKKSLNKKPKNQAQNKGKDKNKDQDTNSGSKTVSATPSLFQSSDGLFHELSQMGSNTNTVNINGDEAITLIKTPTTHALAKIQTNAGVMAGSASGPLEITGGFLNTISAPLTDYPGNSMVSSAASSTSAPTSRSNLARPHKEEDETSYKTLQEGVGKSMVRQKTFVDHMESVSQRRRHEDAAGTREGTKEGARANKVILISQTHQETRFALMNGGVLDDFDCEIGDNRLKKGNVYWARITQIRSALNAVFVDYGEDKQGFLAFSEIHPSYYQGVDQGSGMGPISGSVSGSNGAGFTEIGPVGGISGDDAAFTSSPDLQTSQALALEDGEDEPSPRLHAIKNLAIGHLIRRNQMVLVQVLKDARGTKGAFLTTYISLPGRMSVFLPNTPKSSGISKKVTDSKERARLKEVLDSLDLPSSQSLILRTPALLYDFKAIQQDCQLLQDLWAGLCRQSLKNPVLNPGLVYEESALIFRVLRDYYREDVQSVWVQGQEAYDKTLTFVQQCLPKGLDKGHDKGYDKGNQEALRIHRYTNTRVSLFQAFHIEDMLANIYDPVVPLPSGGFLVINPTEALVAIDVNSGKSTLERNASDTAMKTNLEACHVIAQQLRLRKLSGQIVIDFIDVPKTKNALIEDTFQEAVQRDKARIKVGKMNEFCLLTLSRQQLRPSLMESNTLACSHCQGTGRLLSANVLVNRGLNALREALDQRKAQGLLTSPLKAYASPPMVMALLNQGRQRLQALEDTYDSVIYVLMDKTLPVQSVVLEPEPLKE